MLGANPTWKTRIAMPELRNFRSPTHRKSARFDMSGLTRFLPRAADEGRSHVYYLLVGYLAFVFLCGGGSRADVQSLIILRPLAVLVCGAALLTLRWSDLRHYRFVSIMACLMLLLALLHIVPLPPSVWQGLPGRDFVVEMERAIGMSDEWRPISLVPSAAQNSFFALFVPLAALLLVVQLELHDLRRLARPLLLIGAISGLLGIFQIVGDPNGSLYLYRITNNGQSVGLFANRNHQAVFLVTMFPLLALYASQPLRMDDQIKTRLVVCTAAAVILVPLVLVTGSRQALVLSPLAIGAAFWIYKRPQASVARRRGEGKNYTTMFAAIAAAMLLVVIMAVASRAEALNRLIATDLNEEVRGKASQVVVDLVGTYFPIGSGAGTFAEVYQIAEPLRDLNPTYLNRAHNDYLDVALTHGLPGLLLVAAAMIAFARAAGVIARRRASGRPGERLARVGLSIVLVIGLASFVDYPLRAPSLGCFFVVACCWIYAGLPKKTNSTGLGQGD